MKIQYLGEDIPLALTCGKVYNVLAVEKGPDFIFGKDEADWLRIVTDNGEDYIFQLVEGTDYRVVQKTDE